MLPAEIERALAILDRHGAVAWVDTGTALGLAREGRILWPPGEDDIDLSVWSHEAATLERAASDFEVLGYRRETWLWRGAAFKWKFMPADSRLTYPIDIKLYRRCGLSAWTPLVRQRTPPTRPMHAIWSRWRDHLLQRGHERRLGEWPWSACFAVDTFIVPARYFDDLASWRGTRARMPRDLDGFLRAHYGEWTQPVRAWHAPRQDGTVRRGAPERALSRSVLGMVDA